MKKAKRKVRVQTITYARIKNIGNYENERLEVTGIVSAGEDPAKVLRELKGFTLSSLGLRVKGVVTKGENSHPFTCICDECY